MVVLRSMRRLRNILLGGTTLQANANFPTTESSSFLVQVLLPWSLSSAGTISAFLSCVILAYIVTVSSRTPRNVRRVVGPSTFSGFTAALTREQSESMCCMFLW